MKRKGFTLIELMIVITVLGIFLAIMIPAYKNYQDRRDGVMVEGDGNYVSVNDRVTGSDYHITRHEYIEDGTVCYVAKSRSSPRLSISCVDTTP